MPSVELEIVCDDTPVLPYGVRRVGSETILSRFRNVEDAEFFRDNRPQPDKDESYE